MTGDQFSPPQILGLFDAYDGEVVDYESGLVSTGGMLRQNCERLSSQMARAGVSEGDLVVLQAPNGAAFYYAFAATLMVGACPLPIIASAARHEINHLADTHGARWLLNATQPGGATRPSPGSDWVEPLAPAFERPPLPVAVPLHLTSGSTGTPKLAMRPSSAAIAEASHYAATLGIDSDDTIHCVTPLSHAYAFGMGFMVSLLTGASIVVTRSFNPRLTCRILDGNGATIFPAAPAMLPLLVKSRLRSTGRLRHLLTAGAPLPPAAAALFEKEAGITAHQLYGTTETGGISVSRSAYRASVVGRPMDGVAVKLCDVDEEAGVGRLMVQSSSMMSGYAGPDGSLSGLGHGGWFKTDDLGILAEDGEIELLGRVSDVVNVCGFKVMPREVEAVISKMPQVVEVKAYRARSRAGDEMLAVAIVASERLGRASVQEVCLSMMARHKCPSAVHVLNDLPRLGNGKVNVGQLPGAIQPV